MLRAPFAALVAVLVASAAGSSHASPAAFPVPLATFKLETLSQAAPRGDSATVRVRVIIPEGWHIQSNAPLDEFLIPTEVKASGKGLEFGKPVFPRPRMKELAALGGEVALFEDTLDVRMPVRFRASGAGAAKALEAATVNVRYQACNDSQCLPPRTIAAKHEK